MLLRIADICQQRYQGELFLCNSTTATASKISIVLKWHCTMSDTSLERQCCRKFIRLLTFPQSYLCCPSCNSLNNILTGTKMGLRIFVHNSNHPYDQVTAHELQHARLIKFILISLKNQYVIKLIQNSWKLKQYEIKNVKQSTSY